MPAPNRPVVLVVDDHADGERAMLREWEESLELRIRHPNDVNQADVEAADLVVVDFVISDWPQRDQLQVLALKPPDGLALAAILRGHSTMLSSNPIAFLLRSAHLEQLSNGLPPETRLHVIAQQYNLEWAQPKNGDIDVQSRQIRSLALATKELPENWPTDDANETRQLVEKWLSIPSDRWRDVAWQEIEECHPPLHDMTDRRRGLRFLRWFLHRVLPYPCFLWTSARLAARLRVTHESLLEAFNTGLDKVFESACFKGHLHDFVDKRWWRSGFEAALWDMTDGKSFDPDTILTALNRCCNGNLQKLPFSQPVVCVTDSYQLSSQIINIDDAIRVQPDEWPSYAEQAWVPITNVKENGRLRAAVVTFDRVQIDNEESEGDVA